MASASSVMRATFRGTQHGQVVSNVIHFKTTDLAAGTAVPFADFRALAEALDDWYNLQVVPKLNESYLYFATGLSEVTGWTLDGEPGSEALATLTFGNVTLVTTNFANPGLVTGDPMPNQTSLIANAMTSLAGRRNRGRVKVGALSESDNDVTGLLVSTALTAWQNVFSGLATTGFEIPDASGTFYRWCILSKRDLAFLEPGSEPIRDRAAKVEQAVVSANWGQQRSRRQVIGGS